MSITGLDAATLARSLRRMAGDGSVEWVMEPIQASVLLDIADALDENAKLRELVLHFCKIAVKHCFTCPYEPTRECDGCEIADGERCMRELGIEVPQ